MQKRRAWKWLCVGLVFLAGSAFARPPEHILNQAESSMTIRGHVLIEYDGSVSGFELEQPEKLPPVVVQLVERVAPTWRFEPVLIDGEPRRGKASMRLRLLANNLGDGSYRVSVDEGYFGKDALLMDWQKLSEEQREALADTSLPSTAKQTKLRFPEDAAAMGAQGRVYVMVQFGRDGRPQDVLAEQVNLWNWGTPSEMERARDLLANSAIRGVRRWTFQPPTTGPLVEQDSWTGRVTVDYVLDRHIAPIYGRWHTYIPGPRQVAPWLPDDLDEQASPELAVGEGFSPAGFGVKLLTPVGGG